jgi:hypothetical protein
VQFFSQYGLDRFLLEHFFHGRRERGFLEIGGSEDSRTRLFETSMAWSGRRIEPAEWRKQQESAAAKEIDYLALGPGAADLVAELDLARLRPAVVSIATAPPKISERMAEQGYDHVAKVGPDDIFKRRDVEELTQVSAICAVWHKDPNRLALLRGHRDNLARQSMKVEPIYVFDGGDELPTWLDARAISVREDLTIFQAWNAALALVSTPLVMNLNLDDRLAPDAVEILERELSRAGAVAVGGDWKVCYSQAETDDVEPCCLSERVPFSPEWPPRPGSFRRLVCGTHNFGSLGPAALWRMEAHVAVPRYPWRFAEGTLVRYAGDLAWLQTLSSVAGGKVACVPMIIGNYHSHPSDQAEFRKPPYDEVQMLKDIGVARS